MQACAQIDAINDVAGCLSVQRIFHGPEYLGFVFGTSDWRHCKQVCASNDRCVAFNYFGQTLFCELWGGDVENLSLVEPGGEDVVLKGPRSCNQTADS